MKKYKVILACLKADFGQDGIEKFDDNGLFINSSWEFENAYKPWKQLADEGVVDLETHWVDIQGGDTGRERLVSLAKDADFIYQVPVTHALGIHLPQARQIIDAGTPIVSFHPDLHMRYKHQSGDRFVLSRITEGYDTHTISPAKHMMQTLIDDGVKAYHMPFGIPAWCDRQPADDAEIHDVTFVGQKHGLREKVVSQLRGAGITVQTWGHFWPSHSDHHGRPTCSEMVDIFNHSKVNLNLRWCSRNPSHGQIKGRCLELTGCGAFMLASQHIETDDFHELYTPGKEFTEYHLVDEMIEGIKYYLDHDDERQVIADTAYFKRQDNLWTTRLRRFLSDWGTW